MASKFYRNSFIGISLLLLTAFISTLTTVQAAEKKEIVIGAPLPLTGMLSVMGREQK